MNILYAQFIAAAALLIIFLSLQCKKKKNLTILQNIGNILYAIQYYLLNVSEATIMNIITILRCILFYRYDKENKKIPIFYTLTICIAIIVIGFSVYTGFFSIIPILITLLCTIGASFKNQKIFRIIFFMCSFIWIIYNSLNNAYVCIFGNILEIISSIAYFINTKKSLKK